jgi:hypothetical protein
MRADAGRRVGRVYQQTIEPLPYVSWEERAEPVALPESNLIIVEVETKFEYTAELATYTMEGVQRFGDRLRATTPQCEVWLMPRVEGVEEVIVGSTIGEPSGFQKFATSGVAWPSISYSGSLD